MLAFIVVFVRNFPFSSWYTGWDNLHPEFNFPLNIQRALSAVWQSNQGLGTIGGHGYAATLLHSLFLYLLSFILPIMYLRSTFTFLMLFTGSLGVFFLLRKILHASCHPRPDWGSSQEDSRFRGNDNNVTHVNQENFINIASLLAALYYLLNFGTVQTFYIQLEAFIVHFAALPWLFLTLINYLETPRRKTLFWFILVSLLASVQGFIPPLFVVYCILLTIFLLAFIIQNFNSGNIKKALLILFLTLALNAYWFVPVSFYTFTRTGSYLNSYNNLSSTDDFILKNKKYGDLSDVILQRSFIIESIDADENGNVFTIFSAWDQHLNLPLVRVIAYLFFAVMLAGLFFGFKKKQPYYYPAIGICFLISFTLLATNTPVLKWVSDLLQTLPVFKQAFRVAATKFSISVAFFYALSLGIGIYFILNLIEKHLQKLRSLNKVLPIILFVLLIYLCFPVFTGNLLYSRTKIQIPDSYFSLFSFFNKQNKTDRIANLPQGWNWGWSIYKWGYSGSGFLWYGIEQPILDRAFDVWGAQNENYYWELSYAVYSENFPLVDKVIAKYNVTWLVFDKNIVPYPNPSYVFYNADLINYLNHSSKYTLVKTITSKQKDVKPILIYKVKQASPQKILLPLSQVPNIGPTYQYGSLDKAYNDNGAYYTDPSLPFDQYYPFRALFTNRSTTELPYNIQDAGNNFIITTSLPSSVSNYNLNPLLLNLGIDPVIPTIINSQKSLSVEIPKSSQANSYDSDLDHYFLNHKPSDCKMTTTPSERLQQNVIGNNILRFSSTDTENCYTIVLNNLWQRYGYLVQIENRHVTGKPFQFAVINDDSHKTDVTNELTIQTSLTTNYEIIPPMKYYGLGYSLNFDNVSIGPFSSSNDLKRVAVYPIPFTLLTNIKLVNPVKIDKPGNLYIYYESYDPGWLAYEIPNVKSQISNPIVQLFPMFFGTQLTNHVLVDNWANGWSGVPQSDKSSIVVIFWPQYLEYAGFALGIITLIALALPLLRRKKHSLKSTSEKVYGYGK